MKSLVFSLLLLLPLTGRTEVFPVPKHPAGISRELAGFVREYGAEMGLAMNAQSGVIRLGDTKKSSAALPPCLILSLEDFVRKLPKQNIELGMVVALKNYLSVSVRSAQLAGCISGSRASGPRLNAKGRRLLSEFLLDRGNCGKHAAANSPHGQISEIGISPDMSGAPAGNQNLRALRGLETALSAPASAFDGAGKAAGQAGLAVNTSGAARPGKREAPAVSGGPAAAGHGRLFRTAPPKPSKEEKPRRVRSRFTDVRAARRRWKERNIPVISPVMDFFAGMVQFAQDDGDIIRYEGITSPRGRKAALDFVVNTFWLLMYSPSVSNAVTGVAAKTASAIFNGGSAVAGNYRFLARFRSVPGAAYSQAEPVWIGVEKIQEGAAKGIIHVGFAKLQAGAHLGLNFLGETHVYLSHIYVRAIDVTVPTPLVRELIRSFPPVKQCAKAARP